MIDTDLEQQIMSFIREQVRLMDFGNVQFTLTVQAHQATDLWGERVKTHMKLTKNKT